MGYSMLKNSGVQRQCDANGLQFFALKFIRERCQDLRFDSAKAAEEKKNQTYLGKSRKPNQIPYNMQMDIDRLCLENALARFLKSGKKADAFDVYFCYLEMYIGNHKNTRKMVDLLSEFETNGSELLMKHRDHYSHSVYVFALGLAIFESNSLYRAAYCKYYGLIDDNKAAYHFLEYWGLSSLFHDIGYPFELPFEQVVSYFEVNGEERGRDNPYIGYHQLSKFININESAKERIGKLFPEKEFATTDELFAYILADKLGKAYNININDMCNCLDTKPTEPDKYNYFMDHAYFSANILFSYFFASTDKEINKEHLDAMTAILMHNSLYKFSIAHYKDKTNIPFKVELHPLAYMLMLCDELQCWDRTAYGRNSKNELHPMDCIFDFSNNSIKAVYCYDNKECFKIRRFEDEYNKWLASDRTSKTPKLKAYSGMFIKGNGGKSDFQNDIERIVDLSEIKLNVETVLADNIRSKGKDFLSESKFINLYNFALILNGRWKCENEWKTAKESGQVENFLSVISEKKDFEILFDELSLEYKLSNINQAKAFTKYLNEIGCFYTDKSVDFEMLEGFTEDELVKIGVLEHQRWLQDHYDMGWEYSVPPDEERDRLRQHIDMIPDYDNISNPDVPLKSAEENYNRLNKAERDKDTEPMECMLALLKMYDGLRIYRIRD